MVSPLLYVAPSELVLEDSGSVGWYQNTRKGQTICMIWGVLCGQGFSHNPIIYPYMGL